jgi:hypothetical protein
MNGNAKQKHNGTNSGRVGLNLCHFGPNENHQSYGLFWRRTCVYCEITICDEFVILIVNGFMNGMFHVKT